MEENVNEPENVGFPNWSQLSPKMILKQETSMTIRVNSRWKKLKIVTLKNVLSLKIGRNGQAALRRVAEVLDEKQENVLKLQKMGEDPETYLTITHVRDH